MLLNSQNCAFVEHMTVLFGKMVRGLIIQLCKTSWISKAIVLCLGRNDIKEIKSYNVHLK